jgi:hypothetical protein
MDKYNDLQNANNPKIAVDQNEKCFNNQCNNEKENGYDLCRECIQQFVRICTCNKTFITDKPKQYVLGKKNSVITVLELPDPIPEFFYTKITGNLYHILGCRGCQHIEEISIQNNFTDALQASIQSCVFQKVEENDQIFYEYLSDALDPVFEEYLERRGIKVGEPAKIIAGEDTSENQSTPSGPLIEIPR